MGLMYLKLDMGGSRIIFNSITHEHTCHMQMISHTHTYTQTIKFTHNAPFAEFRNKNLTMRELSVANVYFFIRFERYYEAF